MKNLFSNRKKTPTVLQMEVTECGAAALGMILAYYGKYVPLEQLRSDCGVTRNGSKASLIVKAARSYGLEAKGFRALIDQLDNFAAPMILFWNFTHFLVYEGHSRNKKHYYLNDPAVGPVTVDRETFEKSYTGVVLTFEPVENFTPSGTKFNIWKAIRPMLYGMKSTMGIIIWGGLLLVLPGVLIPGMMQFFVDQILPGKTGLLVPLLALFVATMLLQALLSYIVSYALHQGTLQLAINKTLGMLNYLFTLPAEFFSQRSSGDLQNRILLNSTAINSIFGTVLRARREDVGIFGRVDMQVDISRDILEADRLYDQAKRILGITDSFQGQRDATASSGVAKQLQIQQANGRLDSKRRMKNAAYADIDRTMFEFYLAYADEPRPATYMDVYGRRQNVAFNRYDFLERDEAGNYYYNDSYLFSADGTIDIEGDRETLWKETTANYQAGTYGDPALPQTRLIYWLNMERLHYPYAQENVERMQMEIERMTEPQQPQYANYGDYIRGGVQ